MLNGEVHMMNFTTSLAFQVGLLDTKDNQGYDYIRLKTYANHEGYPFDYTGTSGGGIWYQMVVTTDYINYKIVPILAGIVCWQTVNVKDKIRTLSGHYINSIFELREKVRATLNR
ncbi:MAG TPA: hypothetical protein VK742_19720 [Candidatus Sulfotelmatobacter sp.]|jgi:hypothetical protein|nr:hypothetical protein [Candidatus Sulfotelmatobacter sp.]